MFGSQRGRFGALNTSFLYGFDGMRVKTMWFPVVFPPSDERCMICMRLAVGVLSARLDMDQKACTLSQGMATSLCHFGVTL